MKRTLYLNLGVIFALTALVSEANTKSVTDAEDNIKDENLSRRLAALEKEVEQLKSQLKDLTSSQSRLVQLHFIYIHVVEIKETVNKSMQESGRCCILVISVFIRDSDIVTTSMNVAHHFPIHLKPRNSRWR